LKGQIYKKLRDYPKAMTAFEKILADYKEEIRADNALFEMAELYETRLDQKDKAKELYEKLFTEFTDSSLAVEARKRFRILRGDKIGKEQ
jgi:TolA-binding protein